MVQTSCLTGADRPPPPSVNYHAMCHGSTTLAGSLFCSQGSTGRLTRCRAGSDRVEQPPLAELEQRLAEAVSREDWDVAVTLRDELKCVHPSFDR